MTPDDVDAAIALKEKLDGDKRIAAAASYETTGEAAADLDEVERIRFLYLEREMILRYQLNDAFDPDSIAVLRCVAHDEAIRQVAAARMNGFVPKVSWDDLKKEG